jgi:predicted secreted hydrolase
VSCTARLAVTGTAPPFGGEPDRPVEAPGEEFARGHYEQLVAVSGTLEVGDEETPLRGFGLRDHSWGPRTWQAPWYYRWLTANFGPGAGFGLSRVARRDGPGTRTGFVWDDGALRSVDQLEVTTVWSKGSLPSPVQLRVGVVAGGRRLEVQGTVLRTVPLRNRRRGSDGMLETRIAEGLTRWTLSDGRVGFGWAEYLDQVIDGQVVGLAE